MYCNDGYGHSLIDFFSYLYLKEYRSNGEFLVKALTKDGKFFQENHVAEWKYLSKFFYLT